MDNVGSHLVVERCPQCGANLPPGGEEVICEYCGSRVIRRRPVAEETGAAVQGIRLKTLTCVDQQGIGIEAFRMLIPTDWEFSGGVHWLLNNPGMPGVIAFLVRNPQGEEAFEVFPNLSFYWTNNPMTTMMFPVGSLYYGNEVRPPMSALQVLREIVIPRFRGQMPGLQIVHQEPLPDLARQLGAGQPVGPQTVVSADGATIRIRYPRGAKTIEEAMYGVVEVTRVPMPIFGGLGGVAENIFWMAEYLFSCRAEADRLESLSGLFRAMATSCRVNPEWYVRYVQLVQFLIQNQIQHIQHVGQISRIISQTSSQMREENLQGFYQRQQIYDRISENVSQTIRGVDAYYNPLEERSIELPGGYDQAWTNSLGEYILSNDPNFNPNIGSNLNWQQMERKR